MTTPLGTLSQIHRHPIKSLQGERLEETLLTKRGLPGDRVWAVRDEVRGGIRGGRNLAGLMKLSSHFQEPPSEEGSSPAVVTFEDGSTASTDDEDVSQRISAALGQEVTLWPLLPKEEKDHYRRGKNSHEDAMTAFRQDMGRNEDEPLPDFAGFPSELLRYATAPGTYFDAYPLLVLTAASLRTLSERGASNFDVRRFRPNLLIDGSEVGFPETEWVGKTLRLGEARLKAEIGCPRCVMTTREFADLPQDPKVMRTLVQEAGGDLGVYASVVQPDRVRLGDELHLDD